MQAIGRTYREKILAVMQIQRSRSRLSFRTRRRRTGCLPLTLLIMVLLGVVVVGRNWIGARLHSMSPQNSADLHSADEAFDDGDLTAAINLTRRIWTHDPSQTGALTLLVRALIYRSYTDYNRAVDREVALQLTTDAMKRFPNTPEIMTAHAFVLQATGQSMEAYELANRVLDHDPENTLARITLALSYGGVGGHENALRESQFAAASGNYPVDSLRALAISYRDLGSYQEAVAAVEGAIAFNNRLLMLHFEQAHYALQMGDTDAATVAYFRVMAFDPDNIKVRLRMCDLSSLIGNRDDAMQYCQDVTGRAPGWVEGWHLLGRMHFLQGDFAKAQQTLNRCSSLAVSQNMPIADRPFDCWYLQGQAAEILGDCDGLMATYNEFQAMATEARLPQTWTYPPEGPPICAPPTPIN